MRNELQDALIRRTDGFVTKHFAASVVADALLPFKVSGATFRETEQDETLEFTPHS